MDSVSGILVNGISGIWYSVSGILVFDFINKQHPNITFSMEKEANNRQAFLDVLVDNVLLQSITKPSTLDFSRTSLASPHIHIRLDWSKP